MKARLDTGLTCNELLPGARRRGSLLALSVVLFTVCVRAFVCEDLIPLSGVSPEIMP